MAGNTYTNQDGLTVRYGTDEAKKYVVSEYRTDGPKRLIEISIDYENLPASSSGDATVADTQAVLPSGALIELVELEVHTAFDDASGDTATLNVGWVQAADESSNTDIDAFIAAATVAELAVGHKKDGTSPCDGAGRGTKLTENKKIVFSVGTQAFTAGKGTVRIYYTIPNKATDTLGTVLS